VERPEGKAENRSTQCWARASARYRLFDAGSLVRLDSFLPYTTRPFWAASVVGAGNNRPDNGNRTLAEDSVPV